MKNKGISIYFSLSILLIVLAMLLNSWLGYRRENLVAYRDHVEKVLNQKESDLKGKLKSLIPQIKKQASFREIDSLVAGDLYTREGYIILAYENDTLVYWSDNDVPFSDSLDKTMLQNSFMRFPNGWFRIIHESAGKDDLIGLILVKNKFPYQNEYLMNKFQRDFNMPRGIRLSLEKGSYDVNSDEGKFLFSMSFPSSIKPTKAENFMLFGLCLAAYIIFLIFLYRAYESLSIFNKRKWLIFPAFMVDVAIIRLLILYFKAPSFLYHSVLFSPYYFATSVLSPSLGDLLVNILTLLVVAYLFYDRFNFSMRSWRKPLRFSISTLMVLLVATLYFVLTDGVEDLVMDSSIVMNLNNILNIDIFGVLGFAILTAAILALFLFAAKIADIIFDRGKGARDYFIAALIAFLIASLVMLIYDFSFRMLINLTVLLIFLFSFAYFLPRKESFKTLTGAVFYIILFAFLTTYLLDDYNALKEKENRKLLASELSSRRDPLLEFEFMRVEKKILADTVLQSMIFSETENDISQQEVSKYLYAHYFNAFWNKYDIQITLCNPSEVLNIQPDSYLVNCYDYFKDQISADGVQTICKHLYFLDNKTETNNYLAYLEFHPANGDTTTSSRIFIELIYKFLNEAGLGYPDLLIDRKAKTNSDLSDYSYARYYKNALIYKYGDYSYKLDVSAYLEKAENSFINLGGYNHYISKDENDNTLVISKKNPSLLDVLAPFSYLFLFFGLFVLTFTILVIFTGPKRKMQMNFRTRLQATIISIIILSFIVVGMITRTYIIRLNNNKNIDILSEKTHSVLIELEQKLGDQDNIPPSLDTYVAELLDKFSSVFFSDINLFDDNGNLIASSRPQIFDENLISRKMQPDAYDQLAFKHILLYIQNEMIGQQEYLSAYIPLRNNRDHIIAYLNLPYFAKQTEMKKEIADFLAAFINTYVLLIVLAVLVTLFVSRYITKPMQLIREKLGLIGIGKSNEKIEWKRNDEIGGLVAEYNRMLDELALSAELLAKSERESAWREMAKQVAHEIKNPLTPMKLSVQYLKKAWDDKSPDWEDRLDRFTRTIVEQIDNLSDIASEFSDFAKMPVASLKKIELSKVIRTSLDLFNDIQNIQFSYQFPDAELFISADEKQMLRVFNNLLKNSIQAIGKKADGEISIMAIIDGRFYKVEISDNGSGISESQADLIFSPSFTTKSSGMGLGLTMVKSILDGIGAEVTFKSTEGKGTTFIIRIPVYEPEI